MGFSVVGHRFSRNPSLDKLFKKINQNVLVVLELLLEGGVAHDLLVVPDFLHSDLLQFLRVVSAYEENKITFIFRAE